MLQRNRHRRPLRLPACPHRVTGLNHDRYQDAPERTVLRAGVDYIGIPAGTRGGAR